MYGWPITLRPAAWYNEAKREVNVMKQAERELKNLFVLLCCGLSAITLFPSTSYARYIPDNGFSITLESWQKTGQSLKNAVAHAGGQIGEKQRK